MGIIEKIFGTHSQNELKRIYPIVDRIEAMESEMKALSDEELRGKTREFKERLGEGETLDDIIPEAFAVVREAAFIAPIGFVRELLEYGPEQVSSAILRLAPGSDPDRVRARIAGIAGDDFRVQTSYQQKESLYRIMQYEKWGIYFIILMVLVIASFSIVGSLIMIIIDKQKDTETLITLGAERKLIRRIFVREGMLISGIGMAAGLVLGIAVCLLQQHFGWIKMAGSSFLVDAYPVEIETTDLLGIVLSVGAIGWAISRFTVGRLISARTGSAAGTNISSDSESKDA